MEPIPKKSLGQHWLADEQALFAMCDAVNVGPTDTVLEIGPGLGTLTQLLVQRAKKVIAVEFDSTLAHQLSSRVPANNLEVIEADILRFDVTKLPPHYKVVANIPYYLTSNLLRVLCESANPPQSMALLMQKEVAERAVALPGDMSMLSISVQFYCEASLGMVVPAVLFTPPPKVDSQILILQYRNKPLFDGVDSKILFRIIKAGFSQKRKKLRSSLSAGLRLSKQQIEDLLQQSGVDPSARPQELSLKEWFSVYEAYEAAN